MSPTGPQSTVRSDSAMRTAGRRAWERWVAIAHVIGTFQARVLLSLFYFVVVPPFALVVKLARDPLGLRAPAQASGWRGREPTDTSVDAARRQS